MLIWIAQNVQLVCWITNTCFFFYKSEKKIFLCAKPENTEFVKDQKKYYEEHDETKTYILCKECKNKLGSLLKVWKLRSRLLPLNVTRLCWITKDLKISVDSGMSIRAILL